MKMRAPRRPSHDPPRVRVVAPSSPFAPERLERGLAVLAAAGFHVEEPPGGVLHGQHAYLNGSDEQRAQDLLSALTDPAVDVVWLARGGYGLTRILDRLPVPDDPPTVVGFSDATALLALLWRRGFRSVHGPLATTLADEPAESLSRLFGLLRGDTPPPTPLQRLSGTGQATGPLLAANLCVLTHLVGTPAMPALSGAVLVLEEVGERPYRIDRMLTQLLAGGGLAEVAGVVVGDLSGCEEPGAPRGDRDPPPPALQIFAERLGPLGIPVASGMALGHRSPNHAVVVGARATLRLQGGGGELVHEEGLFA